MELSEGKRKQETRQLLLADCKEQTQSVIRTLDDVIQELNSDNAEGARGAFEPVPEQVRYVALVLYRLVVLNNEIRKANKGRLGFQADPDSLPGAE